MNGATQFTYFDYKQKQKQEVKVTLQEKATLAYRYAYNRSAECMQNDDPGQDYLAFREDHARLVFVLCDGVSQSFFGDVAASFLGDRLVDWLWSSAALRVNEIALALQNYLSSLVPNATERVAITPLEDGIPDMLRSVLEEKRATGSETMFVAGVVDTTHCKAILLSLGDMRLRVWNQSKFEITNELGLSPNTNERWSTLRGSIGTVHVKELPLEKIYSIAAYSDGLARVDKAPLFRLSNRAVQESIYLSLESPSSDDVSFFQIWIGKAPPDPIPLSAPKANVIDQKGTRTLSWHKIAQATEYEILVNNSRQYRFRTTDNSWLVPNELISTGINIQLRAWCGDEPGEWSDVLSLKTISAIEPQPILSQADLPPTQDIPISPKQIEQGSQPAPTLDIPDVKHKKLSKWVAIPMLLFLCGMICVLSLSLSIVVLPSLLATATPTATRTSKPLFPPRRIPTRTSTPSPFNTITSTISPSNTATKPVPVTSTASITPTTDATALPTDTTTITATFTVTSNQTPTEMDTITKPTTPPPASPITTLAILPPINPSTSVPLQP